MTSLKLLFLLLVLALCVALHAATPDEPLADKEAQSPWSFEVSAGVAVGGATPIPFDRTIRSIRSLTPTGCAAIEVDALRQLGPRWGLRSGLRLSWQGITSEVRVKNYHTQLTMHRDRLTGYYTGLDKNHERFCLLTVPILATYRLGSRWQLSAGPYVQWALHRRFFGSVYEGYLREGTPTGLKVAFDRNTPATYDFSHSMRRFLWGGEVGCRWQAYRRLSAFAAFDIGFNDAFHHSFRTVNFKMYPVATTLGVGYRL